MERAHDMLCISSTSRTAVALWYCRDLLTQSNKTADEKSFRLSLPAGLNNSSVAYSLVYSDEPKRWLSAKQIVTQNSVFACGGFFIGRVDVMWNWTTEYFTAVERMVSEKWISTDQQVLYWLFFGQGYVKLKPRTCLQLYKSDGQINPWDTWMESIWDTWQRSRCTLDHLLFP